MVAGSGRAAVYRMKIWSGIILMAAFISAAGFTDESFANPACVCTLEWQSSSGAAGYALYYGTSGSLMTNRLDVGLATAATVKNLTAASTYYFYVVAYDSGQIESAPSNLLPYTAPAMSSLQLIQLTDGSMNLSFHVAPGAACHVEYTAALNPPSWTVLTNTVADSNGLVTISDPVVCSGNRFYRAVIP
jgi:hypothetical protein